MPSLAAPGARLARAVSDGAEPHDPTSYDDADAAAAEAERAEAEDGVLPPDSDEDDDEDEEDAVIAQEVGVEEDLDAAAAEDEAELAAAAAELRAAFEESVRRAGSLKESITRLRAEAAPLIASSSVDRPPATSLPGRAPAALVRDAVGWEPPALGPARGVPITPPRKPPTVDSRAIAAAPGEVPLLSPGLAGLLLSGPDGDGAIDDYGAGDDMADLADGWDDAEWAAADLGDALDEEADEV